MANRLTHQDEILSFGILRRHLQKFVADKSDPMNNWIVLPRPSAGESNEKKIESVHRSETRGEITDVVVVLDTRVKAQMVTLAMIELDARDIPVGIVGTPLQPQMRTTTIPECRVGKGLEEVQNDVVAVGVEAGNVLGDDEINILTITRQIRMNIRRIRSQLIMAAAAVAALVVIADLIIQVVPQAVSHVGGVQDFPELLASKVLAINNNNLEQYV